MLQGPTEEEIKERVKAIQIAELLRRIDRSGTLDVTSGTVVGYPYYTEDDPVLQFNTEKNGYEFDKDAPLKWDPELDCEYLRDALKGWGTIFLFSSSKFESFWNRGRVCV